MNARTEADLERAGDHLAEAITTVGIDAAAAFLTKGVMAASDRELLMRGDGRPAVRPRQSSATEQRIEGPLISVVTGRPVRNPFTLEPASALTGEKRELVLDLAQLGLDLAGILDPTPISDTTSGLISLGRRDWWGAGISAVSLFPYLGDLAKVGKLGKFVRTIERVVDIAKTDARFAETVRPLMQKLKGALDAVPVDNLPSAMRAPVARLKSKVDEF